MKLFKNKIQRKLERDMQVRQGLGNIRRNLKSLDKNIANYRNKAVRARRIGAEDQLGVLKAAIARSLGQKRMQERQLLTIETAMQMRDQAESMASFATAMQAVSTSIAAAFNTGNMEDSIANYEQAAAQASDMEARMDLMLDMSAEMMEPDESSASAVSMAEIDRLIEEDAKQAEAKAMANRVDEAMYNSAQNA